MRATVPHGARPVQAGVATLPLAEALEFLYLAPYEIPSQGPETLDVEGTVEVVALVQNAPRFEPFDAELEPRPVEPLTAHPNASSPGELRKHTGDTQAAFGRGDFALGVQDLGIHHRNALSRTSLGRAVHNENAP